MRNADWQITCDTFKQNKYVDSFIKHCPEMQEAKALLRTGITKCQFHRSGMMTCRATLGSEERKKKWILKEEMNLVD